MAGVPPSPYRVLSAPPAGSPPDFLRQLAITGGLGNDSYIVDSIGDSVFEKAGEGIDTVLRKGEIGEIYNLGTGTETTNIAMANLILKLLDKPESLIQPITDRPGHDRRYALDCSKVEALGWKNQYNSEQAIEATVKWYVGNEDWWRKIKDGRHYQEYYQRQYAGREVSAPVA